MSDVLKFPTPPSKGKKVPWIMAHVCSQGIKNWKWFIGTDAEGEVAFTCSVCGERFEAKSFLSGITEEPESPS